MTISASDFLKEFTTFQHVRIVIVAGCRNSKSSVPYHKVCVVLVGHLHRKVLAGKVSLDTVCNRAFVPFRIFLVRIHLTDVFLESGLNLRVVCRSGYIRAGCIKIVETAVASCSIGDVPEGICSSTVLKRTTAHGISIAADIFFSVTALCSVCIIALPLSVLEVIGVETVLHEAFSLLLLPLGCYVLI